MISAVAEAGERRAEHRQRHVAADGQVVDQRQREQRRALGAVEQGQALAGVPADGRARVGEVLEDREDAGLAAADDRSPVALAGGRVDVEGDDPLDVTRGDRRVAPGVRAEVPARPTAPSSGSRRSTSASLAAALCVVVRGVARRSRPIRCPRASSRSRDVTRVRLSRRAACRVGLIAFASGALAATGRSACCRCARACRWTWLPRPSDRRVRAGSRDAARSSGIPSRWLRSRPPSRTSRRAISASGARKCSQNWR